MNTLAKLAVTCCLSFVLTACDERAPSPVSVAPTAAPTATPGPTTGAPAVVEEAHAHAGAGVRPGSHEDWCGEHAVPESLCSRCNPSLIAAFKATGDWCEAHGLPESQCRICNPGLVIERPPQEGGTP